MTATTTSEQVSPPTSSIPPPPSRVPQPTGDLVTDVKESVKHITEIPCARNSLLSGIASGAGIGVIRGLSTGPMVAGHWAMATFMIISLGSWHLCQKQIADERKKITRVIESVPRRTLKKTENAADSSSSSGGSTTVLSNAS